MIFTLEMGYISCKTFELEDINILPRNLLRLGEFLYSNYLKRT